MGYCVMGKRRSAQWGCLCATLTLVGSGAVAAESGGSRGFTLYERFQGSSNTLGLVTRLDTSLGYNFNRYFGVDAGIPVYFVRPSGATASAVGTTAGNGIGSAYAELRLTLSNPAVNFASTLTGTAPTGDSSRGFSTGHGTVDWNNHFERTLRRLTPFANLGLANTVSDTVFFVRPFSSQGFIMHLEGGASYSLSRFLSAGASAYAIVPSGEQTIYSKLVTPGKNASSNQGSGTGRGRLQGVFETASATQGTAEIARDNGFTVFLQAHPSAFLEFQAGYTRSIHYALDTFSFGVGVNCGSVLRKLRL